jgi:hypothetical protein
MTVFCEHTSDLNLPSGDAVLEWLLVSSFSSLVFGVSAWCQLKFEKCVYVCTYTANDPVA